MACPNLILLKLTCNRELAAVENLPAIVIPLQIEVYLRLKAILR
jgi:hypothetical protein